MELPQRIGITAATVAAAGAATVSVIAGTAQKEVVIPEPNRLPAASAECSGVEASPNVIGGKLSDGRTWKVVLKDGQAEAKRGVLSPSTQRSLCQVQVDALKDLKLRLSVPGTERTEESTFVVRAELVAQAEAARVLAADDEESAGTNPDLARLEVHALIAYAASPETRAHPEKLRKAYLRMIELAEQHAETGKALGGRTPSTDASYIESGAGGTDALRSEYPGLPEGGSESAALELEIADDATQKNRAAAYQGLGQSLREGSREALLALTLAANPTWAADHPRAQPAPQLVAKMERGLATDTPFAKLRTQADEAYRTSPGVAERHVEPIVNKLIGSKHSALRKQAMKVAADAWKNHRTTEQIQIQVADLRARPLVNDLFFARERGVERGYDRVLSIVRDKLIHGRSVAEIRKAVFADWNAHAPKRDYDRVYIRGATLNRYTAELLLRAESYSKAIGGPAKLYLTQGSYSTSVEASGGTHDRGGAIDISVEGMSNAGIKKAVKALRTAGFAAWHRGPPSFSHHIHGIAIGDTDASDAAKSQVSDYRRGLDGLATPRPDPDYRYAGRPIPKWGR